MVDSAAWPRQLGSARLGWRATILQMKKCVSTVFPPTEQNQTGLNIVLQWLADIRAPPLRTLIYRRPHPKQRHNERHQELPHLRPLDRRAQSTSG